MTPIARSPGRARPALRGAFTALVTPFTPDGALDEDAFRRLVSWQVLSGIDGLVPCGTTGESPTLSPAERERLIAITVEVATARASRRRVTVVAGTGTNDTEATIAATRRAADLGADAALVVAPYYNRPDQRMLEATSGRSPTTAGCRSSSTTSRRGPARTWRRTRSCGWPRTRGSWPSRRPPATSSRSRGSAAIDRATSPSWPATTPGRCRCSRWAGTA